MNLVERRFLIASVTVNLVMAVSGVVFAMITSSQAILLDALFDLTYFFAGLFSLKVADLVHREDDDRFPYGYAHFEPLVNGVKGLLVLGVSLAAMVASIRALLAGGRSIEAGLAVVYAILAAVGCGLIAAFSRRGARRSGSPLLVADAKNWVVNSAISWCVVLAFAAILLLRGTKLAFLTPYVDPAIVVVLVLISISVPVRIAWQALMELLNRAPAEEITEQVRAAIEASTAYMPVQELFVRVIQPGRTRMVLAHVVLPESYMVESLKSLDAVRAKALTRLKELHLATILDMVFTSDREWGAPAPLPTHRDSLFLYSAIYQQGGSIVRTLFSGLDAYLIDGINKTATKLALKTLVVILVFAGMLFTACQAHLALAQEEECDAECQALRKAQDPLADVRAIMTDNTISFGTADEQTSYGFQIQPVYSIPTNLGFNFIARGILPIVGAYQGAELPKLGPEPIGGSGMTWGLSDIMLQGFFVPQTNSSIKFGFGPQVSLRTRTDKVLGGPGWGAGPVGVFFGFAGALAYGGIIGHHWGQDNFSLTTLQPIVFYNLELFGGSYVGYNNSITYDWSASAGDRWQVPLGLTVGKTFLFENGYALDANMGGYGLVARPTGGANAQLKFGISLFFP